MVEHCVDQLLVRGLAVSINQNKSDSAGAFPCRVNDAVPCPGFFRPPLVVGVVAEVGHAVAVLNSDTVIEVIIGFALGAAGDTVLVRDGRDVVDGLHQQDNGVGLDVRVGSGIHSSHIDVDAPTFRDSSIGIRLKLDRGSVVGGRGAEDCPCRQLCASGAGNGDNAGSVGGLMPRQVDLLAMEVKPLIPCVLRVRDHQGSQQVEVDELGLLNGRWAGHIVGEATGHIVDVVGQLGHHSAVNVIGRCSIHEIRTGKFRLHIITSFTLKFGTRRPIRCPLPHKSSAAHRHPM